MTKTQSEGEYADEVVAELTEIVTILGALSLCSFQSSPPSFSLTIVTATPEAAHILLTAKIFVPLHELSFPLTEDLRPNHLRLQEAVTRSIRNHCVDLVEVVGPPFWGNWILGETDSGADEIEESLTEGGCMSAAAMMEVRQMTKAVLGHAFSVASDIEDPGFVQHIFNLLGVSADISEDHAEGIGEIDPLRKLEPIARLRMVDIILDFIARVLHHTDETRQEARSAQIQPATVSFFAVRRIIACTRGSVNRIQFIILKSRADSSF